MAVRDKKEVPAHHTTPQRTSAHSLEDYPAGKAEPIEVWQRVKIATLVPGIGEHPPIVAAAKAIGERIHETGEPGVFSFTHYGDEWTFDVSVGRIR